MVAFDASFLILVFDPNAVSKYSVPRLQERIDLFVAALAKSRTKILIPTPALSEFLTKADKSILEQINDSALVQIAPFDERAAIEAAEMTKNAIRESDKKDPVVAATWSKIKFDRQIVAIAKVANVTTIYSTDPHIAKHAQQVGIMTQTIEDLPEAPTVQQKLDYGENPSEATTSGN